MSFRTLLDTPSETGFLLIGNTFEEVLLSGAQALITLVADRDKILADPDGLLISFKLKAGSPEELLLKWMRQTLFDFSAKRLVMADIHFENLDPENFEVRARAIPCDPDIHGFRQSVNAVTNKGLHLKKTASGWKAEITVLKG